MNRDHRPFFVKQLVQGFQKLYVYHFIRPQLCFLGEDPHIVAPWHLKLFGTPIQIGNSVHIFCASDHKVRIVLWSNKSDSAGITIGDYCLISPGVNINVAQQVTIEKNCMIASNVSISDADWHGVYDRLRTIGDVQPVYLNENVWVGQQSIICKGVTIGRNSIIGAGSVVTRDIPKNVVAAGNPAIVVKELDCQQEFTKRELLFSDPKQLRNDLVNFDRHYLKNNSFAGWLRSIFFPKNTD